MPRSDEDDVVGSGAEAVPSSSLVADTVVLQTVVAQATCSKLPSSAPYVVVHDVPLLSSGADSTKVR